MGFAQDITPAKEDLKRKNLKRTAREEIKMLHDGALLVRLSTRKNAVEALRKQGNEEAANKMQKDQDALNKSIIKAFKTEFKFCPVYFFYSDFSKDVSGKQLDIVPFLDENLIPDKNIRVEKREFLTAEFSSMNAGTMDGTALLIMDEKFEKLRRPFPFFVNIRKGTPLEKAPTQVVAKMEKKLNKFYNK
jgi:hypothetical protein